MQSIDNLYLQGALPLKIDARHIDAKYVSNVRHLFDDIEHLHISSSFGENIEITSDIHDKGSMLKEILKQRGCYQLRKLLLLEMDELYQFT